VDVLQNVRTIIPAASTGLCQVFQRPAQQRDCRTVTCGGSAAVVAFKVAINATLAATSDVVTNAVTGGVVSELVAFMRDAFPTLSAINAESRISVVSFTPLDGGTRLDTDSTALDGAFTSANATAAIVAVDFISSSTTLADSTDIAVGDVVSRLVAQARESTSFLRTRGTFLRHLTAFTDADIAQLAAVNVTAAVHGVILLNATDTASLQRADNSLFSNISVGVIVGVVFGILGGIVVIGLVIFGMWRCSLRCAAKSGGWSGRDRRRRSDKGVDDEADGAGANGDANATLKRRMSRAGSSLGDRRPSMGARRQSMGGRRDSMGGRRASGMGARAPSAASLAAAPNPSSSPSEGVSGSGEVETRRISVVPRKSMHALSGSADAAAAAAAAAGEGGRVGSSAGRRGSRGMLTGDDGGDGDVPTMGRKWSGVYGGRTDWMTPQMRTGSAAGGADPLAATGGTTATVPRLGSVTTSAATRRRNSLSGSGGAGAPGMGGALALGDDVTQVEDPEGGLTGRPESVAGGGGASSFTAASRVDVRSSPLAGPSRMLSPVGATAARRGSGSGAKGDVEGRAASPATLPGSNVTRGRADGVRAALLNAAVPASLSAGSSGATGRDRDVGTVGGSDVTTGEPPSSSADADAAVAHMFAAVASQ